MSTDDDPGSDPDLTESRPYPADLDGYYDDVIASFSKPALDATRENVVLVQERFRTVQRAVERKNMGREDALIVARCPDAHRAKRPALAWAYDTADGLMFESALQWRPEDWLDDPAPWELWHRLGNVRDDVFDDGDALLAATGKLRRRPMRAHYDPLPTRASRQARVFHDLVDLPPSPLGGRMPELWVCCADHPRADRVIDRETMRRQAQEARTVHKRLDFTWPAE